MVNSGSKKRVYNITCGTDDNYAQHCLAMLCSLFDNNIEKFFVVHILINKLSAVYRNNILSLAERYTNVIHFYEMDDSEFFGMKFKKKRPLTNAAYYRLKLPSTLKDIDTVLYLDCDMIVLGDVDEIFNIDLNGYALAACNDAMPYNDLHRRQLNHPVGTKTFCSGIMYINLDYWRSVDSEEKCFEFARKDRCPVYLHDQDVFNYVFKNQWYLLPPKWNVSPNCLTYKSELYRFYDYNEARNHPCLYHFFDAVKPWQDVMCLKKEYYLKYLHMSGCSNIIIEKKSFGQKISAFVRVASYIYKTEVYPYFPEFIKILLHDIEWCFQIIAYILKKIFFPKRCRNSQDLFFFKNFDNR